MSTIFPLSASVNQEFDGYRFNGTSWDIIGQEYNPTVYSGTEPSGAKAGDIWIDSSTDVPSISPETILTINAASATYLTKNSASSTYITQASASTTYQTKVENIDNTEIGYLNNASANIQTQLNSKANLSGATFSNNITAPEVRATTKLVAQTVGGDEGGEILLGKAATNTTLTGDGVTIDVYQNRLRIFEQGGDARGGYIDVSTLGNGVATNLTPGLVLLSTQTLNGSASAVNFSNVLSDTYTRYHVSYQLGCTVDNDMFFRFRENTTDKQASYYGSTGQTSYAGSSSVYASSNLGYWYLGQIPNATINYSTGWFNMYRRPSSPTVGIIHGQYMNSLNLLSGNYSAGNYNMTNFNGFSIYVPSGTLNGKVSLYGYRD
jgi:hypothetical protein